jgi:arylsulfatase A-like enzyme
MSKLVPLLILLLAASPQDRKPNILLIITDDQGYGDLGCHGNPMIRTPHLDAFAKESFEFDAFHVSPVCSPTRSSLLTGRYNYRTGVVDTFLGRSMMHPDEVTLAEMLSPAGYKTGIFGKWHLGDNYPLRAMDQGFQDCLTIRGGGIGQPSDPPGGDHYTDATMYRNGKVLKSKGYCTDVFTDAAIDFIAAKKDQPFFAYVPLNAPHTPLEVPEKYLKPYQDAGLPDTTARLYAMVTNIDDNVGRLLSKLDELQLARDTIVIFMSDNGPQQERYNAGLRGLKGTVFQGGIRVPFFLRWPAYRGVPHAVDVPAAHIDVVPTLLAACGLEKPPGLKFDGQNLMAFLGSGLLIPADRILFFQWHRGDLPEKFKACAARDSRWKLVWTQPQAQPMLFDLQKDRSEKNNVAQEHPDIVERLTKAYDAWFEDVRKTREFAPPRIVLDPAHEDPVVLTRQDWRGPKAGWGKDSDGTWLVAVANETKFDVTLRFRAPGVKSTIKYACGTKAVEGEVASDATSLTLSGVVHPLGPAELGATIGGAKPYGVDYIELKRVD